MQPHPLEHFLEAKFGQTLEKFRQNLANLDKFRQNQKSCIPKNISSLTAMIETYRYHFQCIVLVDARDLTTI